MELNLERPLLFFDIESTGLMIPTDGIIELSFVKVFPGGEQRIKTWKIKPWDYVNNCQLHISEEASKVNGVTDDMLVGCPRFCDVCVEVAEWVKGSDLAGFNSSKFDLPMLAEEFERADLYCGIKTDVDLHSALMVDVLNIYHAMEPRNLKAAYRFYCGGEDFDNAHTAEADTIATYEVLKGQLDKYPNVLKNDVKQLSSYTGKKYVDFSGSLIWGSDGEVYINFGKHKGKTAREVYRTEPSYFDWVSKGSFMLDTKRQFKKLAQQFSDERKRPLSGDEFDKAAQNLREKFNGDSLFQ